MNILLFLPAYGMILLHEVGVKATSVCVTLIVVIQVLMGLPFIMHNPWSYFKMSYDFSRVFLYKWTVNWKMVDQEIFVSPLFAQALVFGFVLSTLCFMNFCWLKHQGGLFKFVRSRFFSKEPVSPRFTNNQIVTILFTSHLLGILFSRSLHYQVFKFFSKES